MAPEEPAQIQMFPEHKSYPTSLVSDIPLFLFGFNHSTTPKTQ